MFQKKSFENIDIEWEEVQELNNSIVELEAYKEEKILVEGNLSKSKIAWKIATLRQAYIWRLHELAKSCAINWSNGHYVSSLILARSVIETGLMLCDFDKNIQKGLIRKNFSFLDQEVMKKTFSTRMEEFDFAGKFFATSILTMLDKKEKELPGIKHVYDNLSEFAHPNYLGSSMNYADLDVKTGTTTYSNEKYLTGKFLSILCAFSLVDLSINTIDRLANNIGEVANLQHELNPVPNA